MAKEDFNQVSASFGAVQCILSSILCPSIFRLICRHFNSSPILCPINATSSSSYVFRLQYQRVLHCRIVLIEKLKTLLALERKKTSHNKFRIGIKTNHLKVTRNLRENSSWLLDRGAEYFHETLFSNSTEKRYTERKHAANYVTPLYQPINYIKLY